MYCVHQGVLKVEICKDSLTTPHTNFFVYRPSCDIIIPERSSTYHVKGYVEESLTYTIMQLYDEITVTYTTKQLYNKIEVPSMSTLHKFIEKKNYIMFELIEDGDW